ncbi:BglG family transcription antiterminator [Streptococcus cameli]
MFNQKTLVILMTLLQEPSISLYTLSVKTKMSMKDIKEQISRLNEYFKDKSLPQLTLHQGGYQLSTQIKNCSEQLIEELRTEQVYLSQNERIFLIYLYTFCRVDFVSNQHYQDFLTVSKNTALSDIKELRHLLKGYNLTLDYTRAKGYTLHGDEEKKHQLALYAISQLLKEPIGFWSLHHVLAAWDYHFEFEKTFQRVEDYYQAFQITPIQSRLEECLFLLAFILFRYQRGVQRIKRSARHFSEALQSLTDVISQDITKDYNLKRELEQEEKQYLTGILSGCFEGDEEQNDSYFLALTRAIIEKMEEVSLLAFEQKEALEKGLKRHIIPAYFRLKYKLYSNNSYTDHIKDSYPDLFDLVHRALQPLENEIGYAIPDTEISYFVVHFGGYLKPVPESPLAYRAMIICPNGVSSSLIIKDRLKDLFPKIDFIGTTKVEDLDTIDEDSYDLIFSTVEIHSSKPHYLVPILMTDEQALRLNELIAKDFPDISEENTLLEKVMKTIRQYASIEREKELRLALQELLIIPKENRKETRPLLHELITEETYQHSSVTLDWREAIELAAKPLLESGQIEANYPPAMIKKVEDFGPFIDLGKGIAIPHARPEDGVNRVGMSMLVLDNPIHLADDPTHEIRLLICIAATDNQTHLKALSHLTTILRDQAKIDQLLASKTYSDIKNIIQQEA